MASHSAFQWSSLIDREGEPFVSSSACVDALGCGFEAAVSPLGHQLAVCLELQDLFCSDVHGQVDHRNFDVLAATGPPALLECGENGECHVDARQRVAEARRHG